MLPTCFYQQLKFKFYMCDTLVCGYDFCLLTVTIVWDLYENDEVGLKILFRF